MFELMLFSMVIGIVIGALTERLVQQRVRRIRKAVCQPTVLGADQLERPMWRAFWHLLDRDKDFRDFAMPGGIIWAMAEEVHDYLKERADG